MSKIVTITLDGPFREGWLILNYTSPDGGRTSIGAAMFHKRDETGKVVTPMTWEGAAQLLFSNMGRPEWPKFLKAAVSKNRIRVNCPDEVDKIVFFAEFNSDLKQEAVPELHPDFVKIEDEVF